MANYSLCCIAGASIRSSVEKPPERDRAWIDDMMETMQDTAGAMNNIKGKRKGGSKASISGSANNKVSLSLLSSASLSLPPCIQGQQPL